MENRRLSSPPRLHVVPALALLIGVVLAAGALRAGAIEGETASGDYTVVRHVLTLSEDGTIAYDEESRSTVSAAYVVNQHTWATSSIPVAVRFNADDAPAGHDVPLLIQHAITTWDGAGSNFAFSWGGDSDGGTGTCKFNIDADGINTIRFQPLPGLTLGQTCTVYPPGNGTKLVEFDMQLNSNANWNSLPQPQGGTFDLPTTILHELGHAAGLGHSDDSSAVMYYQLKSGASKRVLTDDDRDGIQAAYGAGSGSTPTSSPTASPTTTSSSTPGATGTATPPQPTSTSTPQRLRAPQIARD